MPLKYWRTLACVLALGIGGLAVCAEECIRGGVPAGKEVRRGKTDSKTEPPLAVAPPIDAVVVPPPPPPAAPMDSTGPMIVLPLAQSNQPAILPASFEPPIAPKPADPSPATLPPTPPAPVKPMDLGVLPPPPEIGPKQNLSKPEQFPTVAVPPPPPPPMIPKFDPPPAPPTISIPMTATPVPPPAVPAAAPVKAVSNTKPVAGTGQYKMFLRMGGTGSPRFEIRDGDQLVLKVSCEQIELHGAQDGVTALPGLTATGKVKLHGSGLDGTCDQLSIVSAKGEVALKGNVHLMCYRGTTASEVVAETVKFQLARTGETATKFKAAGVSSVVPASMK
jgi:hypothetical protein